MLVLFSLAYIKHLRNARPRQSCFLLHLKALLITIFLLFHIVLIGINVYLYIINHLKGLRKKWTDPVSPINCTPIYLPFASVINPPPDGDDLTYVEDNATKCIQNTLKVILQQF